jgi:hypothetical protein
MLLGRLWLLAIGLTVVAMRTLVNVHQWIPFHYAVNLPYWVAEGTRYWKPGLRRSPA